MHSIATDVTRSVACVSVCLCSTWVSCAKMAEWLNHLFGEHMWAQRTLYHMRSRSPMGTLERETCWPVVMYLRMTVCNPPPRHANLSQPLRSVILAVICVPLYIWIVALIICLESWSWTDSSFHWYLLYITCQFCSTFVHYFELLYIATIRCIHDVGNDGYLTEVQIFAFHFVCKQHFLCILFICQVQCIIMWSVANQRPMCCRNFQKNKRATE